MPVYDVDGRQEVTVAGSTRDRELQGQRSRDDVALTDDTYAPEATDPVDVATFDNDDGDEE